MRGGALVLLAGLGAAAAAAAQAAEQPARRPGLWKMTVATTMGSKAQTPMASTLCIDPSVDKAVGVMDSGLSNKLCSSTTLTRTPTGYAYSGSCSMGEAGTIKSQGTITGDFTTGYKASGDSVISGSSAPAMNGRSTTEITAAWSGPCPAGQKPGDMVLGNGMKLNIMSLRDTLPRVGRAAPPSR